MTSGRDPGVARDAPRPALAAGLVAALAAGHGAAQEGWRPEIPRTWDEAAITSIEVPLPQPQASPVHLTPAEYYSIPAREVYRSFPVYHPDREPPGYWEWLHQQEPEIVFDPGKLRTKEDWIRAGEHVFREGNNYSTGSELQFVRDRRGWEAARIPQTSDGTWPYGSYFVREKGKVELGVDSCATCHSRVMPDGSVLRGAQGNFPLGWTVSYEIRRDIAASGENPKVEEGWSEYRDFAAPWLSPDPNAAILGKTLAAVADLWAAYPPSVMPRERSSLYYPVRVPDLIGVEHRRYLDASGLVQHRAIGDLMRYAALNQGADDLSSFAGLRPGSPDGKSVPPLSGFTRYSDEQLYALALFLYSLVPPANPNTFDEAAARGRSVFERESCGRCHPAPLYTNNHLLPADGFEIPDEHRYRYHVLNLRVGTDPNLTMRTRRGTGYYKVPSLLGVWYRGPFGHDGSVATLEDWFDPGRLRDDYVPTAFRGLRVERRAVPGHRYGTDLPEEERRDLVAFLRTL
jgi:mono/diheme cytochrome c family protein